MVCVDSDERTKKWTNTLIIYVSNVIGLFVCLFACFAFDVVDVNTSERLELLLLGPVS